MNDEKKIQIGLFIVAIVIILFGVYYYYPIYSGTWEHMDILDDMTPLSIMFWIDVVLTIILLFAITYGFYTRNNWARLYTMIYFGYSAFWAIVMIIQGWNAFERYIFFILYVAIITFLLMSPVKTYFTKAENIYRHGPYTLYAKQVRLKGGWTQTIYFFSRGTPKDGTPSPLPSGYQVGVSRRSGMPYLKKK